jgi:hypothetical protein
MWFVHAIPITLGCSVIARPDNRKLCDVPDLFLGTHPGGRRYDILLNSVDIDVPFVIPFCRAILLSLHCSDYPG